MTPENISHAVYRLLRKLALFIVIFTVIDYTGAWFMFNGLKRYYRFRSDADVLCIGHSHAKQGLDEQILSQGGKYKVIKFAVAGTNIYEHRAMAKTFFNMFPESKAVVVYDVHSYSLSHHIISANSRVLFYPYMDDPDMASYLKSVAPSWLEYYARKYIRLLRFNNNELFFIVLRGYIGKHDDASYLRMNATEADLRKARLIPLPMNIDSEELACFRDTLNFLRARKQRVVLLAIPTLDHLSGNQRPEHEMVMSVFRNSAVTSAGVHFLDYNPDYESRIELFADTSHLHKGGRVAVTRDLVRDILLILK